MSEAAAPISELIVEEIVATLSGISVAGGYQQDVTVLKLEADAPTPIDNRVIVSAYAPVLQSSSPNVLDEFIMAVECTFFSIKADTDGDVSGYLARGAADLRRRLMIDYHRAGRAVSTLFAKPAGTNFQDGTGADWADIFRPKASPPYVIVMPRIWFRTLKNNPYQR